MNRISRSEFEAQTHKYWLDYYSNKQLDYNKGLIDSDEMWSVHDCIVGEYGLTLAGVQLEPVRSGELIMDNE